MPANLPVELLVAAALIVALLLVGVALAVSRRAQGQRLAALQETLAAEQERSAIQAAEHHALEAEHQTLAQDRARLETRLAEQADRQAEWRDEQHRLQQRIDQLNDSLQREQQQTAELRERLQQERKNAEEKLALLEQAKEQLRQSFSSLSSEALRHNNESFLKLARENLSRFQSSATEDLSRRQQAIEQLTKPIRERLDKFDTKLEGLEQTRQSAYSALTQQINDLLQIHLPQLHRETADLVRALRQPQARGRWGEVQLKRVVELAGMLEHCDFEEQVSQNTEQGRLRPDLIVRLPGGRQVVVDAKAPVDAYLRAVEAGSEEERQRALKDHARQVRTHITQLSRKDYFDQFHPSPEFVVLFVPGEVFFSAALSQDPELIEYGAENRVIPASPTTLIALLKAVAYGWRQEAMARNAQEVADLGRELYERIGKLADHWQKVGKQLDQAVNAYNSSVGTLESRVLPSARRFRDLGAVHGERDDIALLEPLTTESRVLTADELRNGTREGGPEQTEDSSGAGEDPA